MADEKKAAEGQKRKLVKGRHKSAIKRARQTVKRNERNSGVRAATRTAIKRVIEAVRKKDAAAAKALLPQAVSRLTRAGQKGLVHHRHASRHVARLSSLVAKLG